MSGRLPDEIKLEVYRVCQRLLNERASLPWWAWRRWNAINHAIRALLDSLEDES